jgi:DNA-binding NtrC family response regulator
VSSDSDHIGILAAILKKQGLGCICTSTVSQYGDSLSKHSVGLAFCDPNLPDGDYRNVINASKYAGSKARVVVTSRLADWPEFHDAIRAGAFDVISKPCRSNDVEWMVIQAKRDDRKMARQLMTPNEKSRARGAA